MNHKKIIKTASLFFLILRDWFLLISRKQNHKHVNKLILMVGPYRNLTTYFASMFSLHPELLVLNHAGRRTFSITRTNFISKYSLERYNNFLSFFKNAILTGYKGMRGGSIKYSHAFESNKEFSELFKQNIVNQNEPHSLIWKESHMVTNYLMNNLEEVQKMISNNKNILFFFPVRNPLDCAKSNINTRKHLFFGEKTKAEIKRVTASIFEHYLFFLTLNKQYPGRILFCFENEVSAEEIDKLCSFFGINSNYEWKLKMLSNFNSNSSYDHSQEIIDWSVEQIKTQFVNFPVFKERLISLVLRRK